MQQNKDIIGQVERVTFPKLGGASVLARVDTGARTSSISARATLLDNGQLEVTFLGENFSSQPHTFTTFDVVRVASSNGQTERRYKVKLLVRLAGRSINAHFTLTDRSSQVYAVLVGRNVLRGKFIVDISQGSPDKTAEKKRSQELQKRRSI